jgi:hypothetical protein
LDGEASYELPLLLRGGLAYFTVRPPTEDELNDPCIPHVHLMSDMPWDASKYDEGERGRDTLPNSNTVDMCTKENVDYDCGAFMEH